MSDSATTQARAPGLWAEWRDRLKWLERIPPIGWVAILSLVLIGVYGTGYVGYDTSFTLVWAKQILHGHRPEFLIYQSPTPHPLTTYYCILLSLLPGTIPLGVAGVLGLVFFAILGVVTFQLGKRLFSTPVGIVFALIVLTRPRFVEQAQNASVEIPWLALIIGAAAMEARRPKRGLPVLALLGVAGLLRPETWLLIGAYTLYLLPHRRLRERLAIVTAALAAPVIWLVTDFILARDALFSLTHTQDVGEATQTAHGGLGAIRSAVTALGGILHPAIVVGAAIGLLYVLRADRRRAVLPLALIVLGSVSFFAIGLSGLPTLSRFFFLPSLVLALFCAVVVAGWRPEGDRRPRRPVELVVWGAIVLGALASLPLEAQRLTNADHYATTARHFEVDLHTLVRNPVARAWIRRCPTVGFHTNRVRPFLDLWLGKPYPILEMEDFVAAHGGLLFQRPSDRDKFVVPPSFREIYRNRSWTMYERCGLRA